MVAEPVVHAGLGTRELDGRIKAADYTVVRHAEPGKAEVSSSRFPCRVSVGTAGAMNGNVRGAVLFYGKFEAALLAHLGPKQSYKGLKGSAVFFRKSAPNVFHSVLFKVGNCL